MKRDLGALAGRSFDVLVIGAGIHGAWIAWDAALRGLSVALVDRGDFGAGASANSLRIVHGGLRYLQTLDIVRMRESIRERAALLRLAPAQVRPLPCVIATRGNGRDGSLAMRAALGITDLVGFDRNAGLDEAHRLTGGRILNRAQVAALAPELPLEGAGGGALWYDAQAVDSEALTLACVRSAAGAGATVANYTRADGLRDEHGRVLGVHAVDVETGREMDVTARMTILAVGGNRRWFVPPASRDEVPGPRAVAVATNLVVRRPLAGTAAFGVRTALERPDPAGSGSRYLFFVPWRDATMIGTFYRLVDAADAERPVSRPQIDEMVRVARDAAPSFAFDAGDVGLVHRGVLPLKANYEPGDPLTLAERSRIIHYPGMEGLIQVEGVKFTTARHVAEQAVNAACAFLGRSKAGTTAATPLDFGAGGLSADPSREADRSRVLRAIRDEMALHLGDVVLRRTQLGATGRPADGRVAEIAGIMAAELGWDPARQAAEVAALDATYEPCEGAGQPLAAAPGGRA